MPAYETAPRPRFRALRGASPAEPRYTSEHESRGAAVLRQLTLLAAEALGARRGHSLLLPHQLLNVTSEDPQSLRQLPLRRIAELGQADRRTWNSSRFGSLVPGT